MIGLNKQSTQPNKEKTTSLKPTPPKSYGTLFDTFIEVLILNQSDILLSY